MFPHRSTLHPACCPTMTQTVSAAKHPWPMPLGAPHRELAAWLHTSVASARRAETACAIMPLLRRCVPATLLCSHPDHATCSSGAPMHVWPRDQTLPACAFLHMQACKLTPSSCAVKACAARWWSRRTTCRPTRWRVRAMQCSPHGRLAELLCSATHRQLWEPTHEQGCRLCACSCLLVSGGEPCYTHPHTCYAAGLHSEQKALMDLLVLARSDKFVGTKRRSGVQVRQCM